MNPAKDAEGAPVRREDPAVTQREAQTVTSSDVRPDTVLDTVPVSGLPVVDVSVADLSVARQIAEVGAPELYAAYYATAWQREWYDVCARDKARNILDFCKALKPRRVLDVGAGNGSVLQKYVDGGLGEEIHAVEISGSGLAELEKRRSARFVAATRFDGIRIPYPDDSFDLVVLSHVLEHVEHPRLLLHEIRRVARHVFVEVPLECAALRSQQRGDWVMDETGHINYYNRDLLRRELQTSGWKVERLEVPPPGVDPYRFLNGARGVLHWRLKRAMLAVAPRLATALSTWNCASLSSRAELPPVSLGRVDARLAT